MPLVTLLYLPTVSVIFLPPAVVLLKRTRVHELTFSYISGRDQVSLLLKQIQKLKTGLQRLQEIATQFNGSERLNEDINYLINAKPLLQEPSRTDDVFDENMSPKV